VEVHEISPNEVKNLFPICNTSGIIICFLIRFMNKKLSILYYLLHAYHLLDILAGFYVPDESVLRFMLS